MRVMSAESKGSNRLSCKLSDRLLEEPVCRKVPTTLRQRNINHGSGAESESRDARLRSGRKHAATQLSEQWPRGRSNPTKWRERRRERERQEVKTRKGERVEK